MKKIAIIGSGFSGLAAACCLAKEGFDVDVYEKNSQLGGRARSFEVDGFKFDMGPSWYWMPEVFEQFFNQFDKSVSDYYDLVRLDPSYVVHFGKDDIVELPANYEELKVLFETIEPGSSSKLDSFLEEAEYKYKVGMSDFVWKKSDSILEFVDARIFKSMFKLDLFSSIAKQVRAKFKNPKIRKILEFPVLFLGATPENTPALYSLMNYADLKLGTWYPKGGMVQIINGMLSVARDLGVNLHTDSEVQKINIDKGAVTSILVNDIEKNCDYVVGAGDYNHIEQQLIDKKYQRYDEKYWDSRVMAPSSLLFYLGYSRRVDGLLHHNLFFDKSFAKHAHEIYVDPQWPSEPLFYICCPSKTDPDVAPEGYENVFILIPLAADLPDSEDLQEQYFEKVNKRTKELLGFDLNEGLVYKRTFSIENFKKDYNSYKGNAYGLANTLKQTAFLKPKIKSAKVSNLFFTGQLSTPGPGVPPSLISGQVVANIITSKS